MLKRVICLLLCLLLIIPSALADFDRDDLDAQVGKIFKNYKTTGGALIVAKHGEIVYERYYGYAYKKAKELVEPDTYFRIASVTKMISAIRVMQLVEQGLLDLDEDISTYLGYEIKNPNTPKVPITLRTIMTHTTSLNSNSGYSRESNTLSYLIAVASKHRNNFYKYAPGTTYKYSNFGAGIMGSLMEAVTGQNVNTVVTEGLFEPLGIDAAYHATLLQQPEKISCIYSKSGSTSRARSAFLNDKWDSSVNPDKHYRITVGSLWVKPRDLCRLGIMLCNGGTLDGVTVLQPETVAEMMASQMGRGVVTIDSPYGLCVNRIDNLLPGKMIYGHQGLINDAVCNLYFDPETELVFAMVTNGGTSKMDDHIAIVSRKLFNLVYSTFN